jgi:spermidine synthase
MLVEIRRTEEEIGFRTYYGREGVVALRGTAMYWNGLWHAPLSRNGSHIGDHNWLQAAVPLLAHAPARGMEALVIGLGAGATVSTLAQSGAVRSVDVYEINPGLRKLLADYAEGTLHVATNPKVRLIWGDGRSGLAVSPKRYDIITQEPLYLKQAGSSLLLSREYMELVRSRLKPGAIFVIYCNAMRHAGQALVVRQTAASVFPFGESFGEGYLLAMSEAPYAFDAAGVERALASADPGDAFVREARSVGVDRIVAFLDRPRPPWTGSPVIVTDDHPVVEYPELADALVAEARRGRGR